MTNCHSFQKGLSIWLKFSTVKVLDKKKKKKESGKESMHLNFESWYLTFGQSRPCSPPFAVARHPLHYCRRFLIFWCCLAGAETKLAQKPALGPALTLCSHRFISIVQNKSHKEKQFQIFGIY